MEKQFITIIDLSDYRTALHNGHRFPRRDVLRSVDTKYTFIRLGQKTYNALMLYTKLFMHICIPENNIFLMSDL